MAKPLLWKGLAQPPQSARTREATCFARNHDLPTAPERAYPRSPANRGKEGEQQAGSEQGADPEALNSLTPCFHFRAPCALSTADAFQHTIYDTIIIPAIFLQGAAFPNILRSPGS